MQYRIQKGDSEEKTPQTRKDYQPISLWLATLHTRNSVSPELCAV